LNFFRNAYCALPVGAEPAAPLPDGAAEPAPEGIAEPLSEDVAEPGFALPAPVLLEDAALCFLCIGCACFFACEAGAALLLPIEPALESAAGAADVGVVAPAAEPDGIPLGSCAWSAANADAVRSAATRLLRTTLFILISFFSFRFFVPYF
jgi:hypothetical protein